SSASSLRRGPSMAIRPTGRRNARRRACPAPPRLRARPRPRRLRRVREIEERTMSKRATERALSESEAKAVARMLRVSPQKLNLVAQLIRGKNEYGALLHEDMKIRDELMEALKQAAVSKIVIERPHKKCRVTIHSARPGVVIGKKGADIEKLRRKVAALTDSDVVINIVEIRKPELDAQLVAESIAQQLERRVAFRRAMKRAVQSAMRLGAGGIRINCSGRLGGAEIARMEWYREGRVPLHTLRADVDYGIATAFTTSG